MSTDYNVYCLECKKARHLGQFMGSKYSFGYGSNDTETPPKIMEWLAEHVDKNHDIRIAWTDSVPDDDLLYEKFRRLDAQLKQDVKRFLKDPARVMRVIQKDKEGNYLMLQILETHVTDQGTEIIVGGFSDGKK